ncbi:SGNH/GDSL hydrolase family protein [Enterococcus timonensis]|uniref:SGNH/GDSL hydrolase family protein n=1 Tax=Enterococcus timonensis TaxID=1852364 RepID=UPI0008D93997|nr:SGNH/GDSL hydrolase family protein [Enterococcus timonensis]
MQIYPNDRIVFFGDSITDADRQKENLDDLGHGFPLFIASQFGARYPEMNLSFYNRGVSGDKVADLNERLQEDVISLMPDVVSIMVGINDTWHNVESPDFGTKKAADYFEAEYRKMLMTLKNAGITRLVLMEPFVLPIPKNRTTWRVDLDQKIQIIRLLAAEFHAEFISLDGLMNAAGIRHGFELYTKDGVHPTPTGYGLITEEWMRHVHPTLELK